MLWPDMIGWGLSFAILLMIAWDNFARPRYRRWQLKKPIDVKFKTGTARDSPEAREFRVPANSEVQIDFRLRPRLHHIQHELTLSIQGDPDRKPLVKSYFNTFVKEGVRRTSHPNSNINHYIDYNDNYHIKGREKHTKGNAYAVGYSVETREPGRYPVRFKVMTEEGDGKSANNLTLIVE